MIISILSNLISKLIHFQNFIRSLSVIKIYQREMSIHCYGADSNHNIRQNNVLTLKSNDFQSTIVYSNQTVSTKQTLQNRPI